jgi:hypothetical protein
LQRSTGVVRLKLHADRSIAPTKIGRAGASGKPDDETAARSSLRTTGRYCAHPHRNRVIAVPFIDFRFPFPRAALQAGVLAA